MAHHAAATVDKQRPPKKQKEHQTPGQMSHRQILEVLTGLLAAFFTAILSSTIVANALPTIMSDLHGSPTDLAWVITAALLANAATTPIWGKLSDMFSKKALVQISIIIFVAGSVLAGLSQNIPTLLTARVIQGIAMGGLTALAQAIIGSIIPPRERGRYSGYMGATMAVATAGGPLLGGFIVDSPLGWRWTFYVCIPLAVIALILLQITLRIPHVKKKAKIDWAGAVLLTAGVSLILIWVSFAGKADYYDWVSWQSAAMLGGGIVLLIAMLFVEAKVSEPIIPLKIISQRTTALAIVASVAVGIVMFSSSSFLGQYFQISRGETPTAAGLLMLPLIFGNLLGSVVTGQLISRFGRWKPYLFSGGILLTAGLALASTIDHQTSIGLVGLYIGLVGLGLGMMLQNLVLSVQNNVAAKDIGTASASVAFFRSFGGAIGVSVLGSILATRVSDLSTSGLAKLGVKPGAAGSSGGVSLDLTDLPAPIANVIRSAYGDATATIFFIAMFAAIVAFICVIFIKEVPLRKTIDIEPEKQVAHGDAALAASMSETAAGYSGIGGGTADALTAETGQFNALDVDAETGRAVAPNGAAASSAVPGGVENGDADNHQGAHVASKNVGSENVRSEAREDPELQERFAAMLRGSAQPDFAGSGVPEIAQSLARTQLLLAEQQAQLSQALVNVGNIAEQQRITAARQNESVQRLGQWEKRLEQERSEQAAAAEYLARHARHIAAESNGSLRAEDFSADKFADDFDNDGYRRNR